MYPTLVALRQLGGSAAVSELDEAVIKVAGVTDDQLAVEFPPESSQSGSKVVYRLAWARSYLKAIGLVDNSERGIWSLNREGARHLDIGREEAEKKLGPAISEYKRRKARERGMEEEAEGADELGDTQVPESTWKQELLGKLKEMDPTAFERLAKRLLREAGFTNLAVTPASGDGGIDGSGIYKPSLVSFPVRFQCKRHKGSVGPEPVRAFRGTLGAGTMGIFITTGTFTPGAKTAATRNAAALPVDLIDGDDLCDLLKDYGLGLEVKERVVEEVTLKPEFFDSV